MIYVVGDGFAWSEKSGADLCVILGAIGAAVGNTT